MAGKGGKIFSQRSGESNTETGGCWRLSLRWSRTAEFLCRDLRHVPCFRPNHGPGLFLKSNYCIGRGGRSAFIPIGGFVASARFASRWGHATIPTGLPVTYMDADVPGGIYFL